MQSKTVEDIFFETPGNFSTFTYIYVVSPGTVDTSQVISIIYDNNYVWK